MGPASPRIAPTIPPQSVAAPEWMSNAADISALQWSERGAEIAHANTSERKPPASWLSSWRCQCSMQARSREGRSMSALSRLCCIRWYTSTRRPGFA